MLPDVNSSRSRLRSSLWEGFLFSPENCAEIVFPPVAKCWGSKQVGIPLANFAHIRYGHSRTLSIFDDWKFGAFSEEKKGDLAPSARGDTPAVRSEYLEHSLEEFVYSNLVSLRKSVALINCIQS